ncbi:MAG: bifunctional folylpolyglutamate synthase/dihydrofolate synthase [Lachnospiraceae bacterium]|nr:bifunctional folylpolyglutamate synthase/dihydrofolate synthase [Lachnospiraceae bacterium]
MKYDEALEYLEGLNKRGIHPGLEGIRALTASLNNPESDLKIIRVVGTNGKGSVSLYLYRILMAAGYRVGLYQSPAVFDEREIIRVNGRNISKADYGRLVGRVMLTNTESIGATRFECETAMALMYFKEKECDFVILEAGLGGALDATNLTDSDVLSVITPIGLDHCGILGSTVEEITRNKAGVIKRDSFCVSASQCPEAKSVLEEVAKEQGAEISFVDPSDLTCIKYKLSGTIFNYGTLKGLKIQRLGVFQPENAAIAIEASFALSKRGLNISETAVRKGLEASVDFGRFEHIGDRPLFFIDGAHNEPAAKRLKDNVETYFTNKEIVYIMGMFKDKDTEAVARIMAPMARSVITVTLPNKVRSETAMGLAETVMRYNPMVTTADSVPEAVELARLMCPKDGVILAFGSLSFMKDVKRAAALKGNKDFHGVK